MNMTYKVNNNFRIYNNRKYMKIIIYKNKKLIIHIFLMKKIL